jgi:hypothetical protein
LIDQWKSFDRFRKGGVTVEFVTIFPLMVMLALLIWQATVCVLAIMETESMLRDEGRYAATMGNLREAEKRGKQSFTDSEYYQLDSFVLEREGRHIVATAVTRIKVVFIPSQDFTYESTKKSVIIH